MTHPIVFVASINKWFIFAHYCMIMRSNKWIMSSKKIKNKQPCTSVPNPAPIQPYKANTIRTTEQYQQQKHNTIRESVIGERKWIRRNDANHSVKETIPPFFREIFTSKSSRWIRIYWSQNERCAPSFVTHLNFYPPFDRIEKRRLRQVSSMKLNSVKFYVTSICVF